MLEAVGGDFTGQADLLLFGDLRLRRKDFAQPLDHAADDLADAGLRDVVPLRHVPGGAVLDVDGFVDLEVAVGGWKLAGGLEGFGHGKLLKSKNRTEGVGSQLRRRYSLV